MGVKVVVGPASSAGDKEHAGVLLQYPTTDGSVVDYGEPPFPPLLMPPFALLPPAALCVRRAARRSALACRSVTCAAVLRVPWLVAVVFLAPRVWTQRR
jgi:hypothetical protein